MDFGNRGNGVSPMEFQGDLATNWKKFKSRYDIFIESFLPEFTKVKRKVILLLHYMDEKGQDILKSFNLSAVDSDKLETVIKIFENDFFKFKNLNIPLAKLTYERHVFFNYIMNHMNNMWRY